jgi:hypothetical protein
MFFNILQFFLLTITLMAEGNNSPKTDTRIKFNKFYKNKPFSPMDY